jgi:hypothetical protein
VQAGIFGQIAPYPTGPEPNSRTDGEATSGMRITNAPVGKAPRGTVGGHALSDSEHRPPLDFVAEDAPVVTPNVAAVLARIVRDLRDHQKHEAA